MGIKGSHNISNGKTNINKDYLIEFLDKGLKLRCQILNIDFHQEIDLSGIEQFCDALEAHVLSACNEHSSN